MRSLSIISYFPRLQVAVLGGSLLTAAATLAAPASAAPKGAAKGAADSATSAAGPDAATKKAAREAYGAGEKAYGTGDYTTALTNFTKAHDLIPTIHAEYWMAMAQSFGTDGGAAFDALNAVLASPDASKVGDEKLAAAKARLEEVKKMPAAVSVTSTPPGAEVSVDGTSQPGVTPTTVNMPAGTHHLGVALKGYEPFTVDVTVKPGQKVDQSAELKTASAVVAPTSADFDYPPAKPAEVAPAPPPKAEHSKLPAYITLGVGVVGAGIGTVFGIQALSAKSDFDKNPTNSNADRAERDALIADMSFGIALTLGITGIVLLSTSDSGSSDATAHQTLHQPARAKLDIAPLVSHTTTGAAARLTF
jgi:PEGA domain